MTDWHGGENPAPRRNVRIIFRDGRSFEGSSSEIMWNHDERDRRNDVVAWEEAKL